MGRGNKKEFEGIKYIQRAYFGYEYLDDCDPCTRTMI
jgi:hypothetical protein